MKSIGVKMTELTQAQIKFLQGQLKSQLEFASTLKELNQSNPEVQKNIEKLEANIQLLQNKLKLEKLVDE
jgi:uncharacterized coiled-coil protein SlyX